MTNSALLSALLTALRPIARFLVKAGIGYREFAEIAKCAFVDVSTSDYGLRGRPTNISRVAVMTGLTRKEVKRIRDKIASGSQVDTSRLVPPAKLLEKWHSDSEFLDGEGRPLSLEFDGSGPTFTRLVKKYGGDIPPGAMRTELQRVGAIEKSSSGGLRVLKRYFRPFEESDQLQRALSQAVYGLALSVDHNVGESLDNSWVERIAFSAKIQRGDSSRVRRVAQDRAAEFVASIDDLFAAYETIYSSDDQNDEPTVVGVGIYYFEDENTESPFSS